MNSNLEKLKNTGCDIEGALERLLGDEELLLDCIGQVLEDENFERLGTAIKENKAEEAFDAAHTLKGIIANTGLSPLYGIIVDLVEPLRIGKADNLEGKYDALLKERDKIKEELIS